MTPEELAWLAGWLEGEGSFGAYRTGKFGSLRVSVTASSIDEDVIQYVQSIAGGTVFRLEPRSSKHHPQFRWSVAKRKDAIDLALLVRPLMRSARRIAQIDRMVEIEASKPRRAKVVEHGTRWRYNKYGCRCDLCREAQRTYNRMHTERKRAENGRV